MKLNLSMLQESQLSNSRHERPEISTSTYSTANFHALPPVWVKRSTRENANWIIQPLAEVRLQQNFVPEIVGIQYDWTFKRQKKPWVGQNDQLHSSPSRPICQKGWGSPFARWKGAAAGWSVVSPDLPRQDDPWWNHKQWQCKTIKTWGNWQLYKGNIGNPYSQTLSATIPRVLGWN